MERATPVRKSHTSTSDLLTWSEAPPTGSSASANVSRSGARSNQPSGGVGKVLFGGQITDEEAESLNRRKPCSGYKLKEMTGSKIFADNGEGDKSESGISDGNVNNRTSVRMVQQAANGISQISFSTEDKVSPKKPTTLPEVAKQRELSGTLESDSESRTKKQLSDAKSKELSGSDIFGPPPEIPRRSLAAARTLEIKENKDMGEPAPRAVRTSVKVSNPAGGQSNIFFGDEPEVKTTKKIHNQKFAELTGNNIFKGDAPPGSAEKPLSVAKLREMSGNDIFADGKVESRDYFGGVRKPPGGESSIALV
ncbi:UNVERIFIED_CONTAM: DNA oxidative demethylase ALK [Sesamum calycinum]|uniref:DNA oxidative demethylase ALK n=1 Tax=Sesamum calycinum TaxID=2727403 RepID=A0AAW2SWV2_9LAMI